MKPKTVEAIYTGGNIWLFFGRLEDGNWFMADDNGSVRIVDADPMNDLDESLMEDWQLEHLIMDLFGNERIEFCDSIIAWLRANHDKHYMTDSEITAYEHWFREEM